MANMSISVLASLLVNATSRGSRWTGREKRDQPAEDSRTHSKLREAARSNAKRKARALSKHRPVLVRWTSASKGGNDRGSGTTSSSNAKNTSSSNNNNSNNNNTGGSSTSPQTTVRGALLALASTESLGRHLVAGAAAIPAGTLLLKETPFAWSLQPEFAEEFCAHCLREVTGSPTRCPECGLVVFCGDACAAVSRKTWHGIECLDASGTPLEPALSGVPPASRVALRAVRRAKREAASKRMDELSKPPPSTTTATVASAAAAAGNASMAAPGARPGFSSTLNGDGNLAIGLGDIQEHYTARCSRDRDLLETEAAVAAVLACGGGGGGGGGARFKAEDVSERGGIDRTGQESCEALAAEMVTSLFKVTTNAFAVSTLRCSKPAVGHVRSVDHCRVAVGLYCMAAMFNHSCVPNALVSFDGREMRVVAVRAIERGEPFTISYGPTASNRLSALERRAWLKKGYFFRCECEGCRGPTAGSTPCPEGQQADTSDSRAGAAAAARLESTEFACTESSCSGALVVGAPSPPRPPPPPLSGGCHLEAGAQRIPPTEAVLPQGSPSSASYEVWCDLCGTRVPHRSFNALLEEDLEDRRLWDEAMMAVAYSERCAVEGGDPRRNRQDASSSSCGGGGSGAGGGRGSGSGSRGRNGQPSRGCSPTKVGVPSTGGVVTAVAAAAALVFERTRWRDRRLCSRSMRRAEAFDLYARLLALEEKFAGAADACTRAVHVLELRFAPEDPELGNEYLKLAELCLNAGWMERCAVACQKARVSLGVSLQPGDEKLEALDSMQTLCEIHRSRRYR